MTYALSPTLTLPKDAATKKFAILGNSGSGKTYAAGVLIEEFLRPSTKDGVAVPVVVIDPVGVWWGLRLDKRGRKDSGIDVPIIGGMHADVALPNELSPSPFADDAGTVIGRTLAETHSSAVLDVSILTGAQQNRFVTDFAIAFFDTMARHRNPFHIVFDEAQLFLPEQAGGGDTRMVGALDKLTRLGRNHGIGHTLISQRPQSVRKASLNMANALMAFELPGHHERKAIKDWIDNVGAGVNDDTAGELLKQLATLETGDGILWSPSWLKTITPIRTRQKRTFDASATPEEVSEIAAGPKQLRSAALIEALTNASPAEHTADPAALKRRIRDRDNTIAELRQTLHELTPGDGHCFSALCGWSIEERVARNEDRATNKGVARKPKAKRKKPAKKRPRNLPGEILRVLEQADADTLHLRDLADAVSLKHDSSHFRRQLKALRDQGHVEKVGRFQVRLKRGVS